MPSRFKPAMRTCRLLCLIVALAVLPAGDRLLADAFAPPPRGRGASHLGYRPGRYWEKALSAQARPGGRYAANAMDHQRWDEPGAKKAHSRTSGLGTKEQMQHEREEGQHCLAQYESAVTDRVQGVAGLKQRWSSRERKMHIWYNGQVVPLFRPRNMVGCLIYKSGSSRWKLLFMHVAGQNIAGGIRAPQGNWATGQVFFGSMMDGTEAAGYISDPSSPRFAIVRNPYSRFLSAYLDKMLESPESQERYLKWVGLQPGEFGRRLTARVGDFEDFTSRIYADFKRMGNLCHINPHFSPQVCLCGFQSGFEYDYVLKLEEQSRWYSGFVKLAGLEHYIRRGWGTDPADEGSDCFWRIPGWTCGQMDYLLAQGCGSDSALLGVINQSTHSQGGGLEHSTGADGKLAKYYRSSSTVEMVTEMFQVDLNRFGYDTM